MFRHRTDEGRLGGRPIERREFLKGITLMGGLAFLSSFLPSCLRRAEPPPELPPPTAATEPSVPIATQIPATKVSLVRTRSRMEGVRRAIGLLQSNPVQGKAVTLKPNFNCAAPNPCPTHNDTLRSLVLTLREMGATQIALAERAFCEISTHKVMEQLGIFSLAKEVGFDIINLQEVGDDGWVHLHPKGANHWRNGFEFPRAYIEAESVVQACCLKTHSHGGHFTMSLKLAVGTLRPGRDYTPPSSIDGYIPRGGESWPWNETNPFYPYLGEMHSSPHIRKMIAEINTAYSPDLIVLDGVDAFVKGSETAGTVARTNVILAGSDRVAIDAVGVAILRLFGTTPEVSQGPIFQQEQIARAVELGLGVKSPAQIQLITDDSESEAFATEVRDVLVGG